MREINGERGRKREDVREWRDGGKEGFISLDELISV